MLYGIENFSIYFLVVKMLSQDQFEYIFTLGPRSYLLSSRNSIQLGYLRLARARSQPRTPRRCHLHDSSQHSSFQEWFPMRLQRPLSPELRTLCLGDGPCAFQLMTLCDNGDIVLERFSIADTVNDKRIYQVRWPLSVYVGLRI